jgi:hypothetical protein
LKRIGSNLDSQDSTVWVERRIAEVLLVYEPLIDGVEYNCEKMGKIENKEKKQRKVVDNPQHLPYMYLPIDNLHKALHFNQSQHIHQMNILGN